MSKRILIVEDDAELAKLIKRFLLDEGFDVNWVADGIEACDRIRSDPPDLVLLDVNLPGMDGVEVVKSVRSDFTGAIIMLTARNDDLTEVSSLNRGADAFLEKPVRPHVLLAHIDANLRRSSTDDRQRDAVRIHDLVVDRGKYEVRLGEDVLALTSAEFELLAYFAEKVGQVVTREELYQALRRIEWDGTDRSMDMRISTLRKKMQDDTPPYRYLKTVRGQGYVLAC